MNQLGKMQHAPGWEALVVVSLTLLGAGCSEHTSSPQGSDVATSYQELAWQLAACSRDREACLTAAGTDTAAQAACEAELQACHDEAKEEFEQLKTDLRGCFDAAKGCVGEADGGAGLRDCGMELRECVKASVPMPPCFAELQACIQGGGTPQDCGGQARECIKASLSTGSGSGFGFFGAPHHDDDAGCEKPDGFGGFGRGFGPRH